MRYPADHKEETRERIVLAASRRFRRAGAGVGIGQLMKTLKMTHGGFYRHFKSKDDLFEAALRKGFEDMRARMLAAIAGAPPGHELEAIIETYLSERHCADAAGGCPVAALASEIAREPRAVRAAFDRAIQEATAAVARFMTGATEDERRRKAGVLLSGMSGTLAVARAISDDDLRRRILSGARKIYIEAFARGA
ncbi:MAG TPA: TetR/AcrR family transcriptional regulator [Thermoanaerobaculia bacterium]|nr:TetR/AcrR family transcriptional regulator [Thermoanaerobaculia bacterium]